MKNKQLLPEIKMLTKLQMKKGNKYIIFISEYLSQETYDRFFFALEKLEISRSDVVFADGIDGSKVRVAEIVEQAKRKLGTKGYHDVAEFYKDDCDCYCHKDKGSCGCKDWNRCCDNGNFDEDHNCQKKIPMPNPKDITKPPIMNLANKIKKGLFLTDDDL